MGCSQRTCADVREFRLANVAAGAATNNTFYYYVPIGHYRRCDIQFEWTAGGTGTVTATIEGSMMPMAYTGSDESGLTYRDVTNQMYGVASWTDDFMANDDSYKAGGFTYLRLKVVTLTTDANTAWVAYCRLEG